MAGKAGFILLTKLRWGSVRTRARAAVKLGELADPSSLPALQNALKDRKDDVRKEVIRAFVKFGPAGVPSLQAILEADQTDTFSQRWIAITELAKFDWPEALPVFGLALRDSNNGIRNVAGNALKHSKNPDARRLLLKALHDPSAVTRREAGQLLGDDENAVAAPELVPLLKDPDVDVRLAVIRSLGQIGGPELGQVLAVTLDDPEPKVRISGMQALRKLEDKHLAIDMLLAGVGDSDPLVRHLSILWLGQIKSPVVLEPLSSALRDPEVTNQRAAIDSLASTELEEAWDAIAEALPDLSGDASFEAAVALKKRNDPRCVPALAGLLADSAQTRRAQILGMLEELGWTPDGEEQKQWCERLRERERAALRSRNAAREKDWNKAIQEGAAALPGLADAACRMDGENGPIEEALGAIWTVMSRHAAEATEEELQRVAGMPDQLVRTVTVVMFAADIQAAIAIGGMQKEEVRRFPVDCTGVKHAAKAELERRATAGPPEPPPVVIPEPPPVVVAKPQPEPELDLRPSPLPVAAKEPIPVPEPVPESRADNPPDDGYVRFRCPKCTKRLKALHEQARKKAKCNKCGTSVLIPGEPPAAKPAGQWSLTTGAEARRLAVSQYVLRESDQFEAAVLTFSAKPVPGMVEVSGVVTCHVCAADVPFEVECFTAGLSSKRIPCGKCSSQIDLMSTAGEKDDGCFLAASPGTQPVGSRTIPIRLRVTKAGELKLDPEPPPKPVPVPQAPPPEPQVGARHCARCEAALTWWSRKMLGGMMGQPGVHTFGTFGGSGGRPSFFAGVCPTCQDGYCTTHARTTCPKCSGGLTE